jgi:cyclic beta-1,2-glucan synthetase
MYRVGIESILGITFVDGALHFDPCIPRDWPGFEATVTRDATRHRIVVQNPNGVSRGVQSIQMDGAPVRDRDVRLLSDGADHTIRVVLG